MIIITIVLYFIVVAFFLYACFPAFSMFLAMFRKRIKPPVSTNELSFACIITAYREFDIALPQIDSLMKQHYSNFHVYLVADNCIKPSIIPQHEGLTVLFPDVPLNGKVLSIKYAIDRFVTKHDVILILDSDNLLHPDVLLHFNNYISAGYAAVQGQRTAKNIDTTVSALDALSELYYNQTQRDTAFLIGSSATIAGSGMAVKFDFFLSYINKLFSDGNQFEIAEDKLLQMMIIQQNNKIAYCREALIFDEKVTNGNQVQRQRTRWIRSWFQHWQTAINMMFNGLFCLNWNKFYFGLMLSFPPMFILVVGLVGVAFIAFFVNLSVVYLAFLGLFIFVIQFFIAMLLSYAPSALWKAIPQIPVFIWRQILAVLKIKTTARNDFMATSHNQFIGIDEVWAKRKADFPYL